jgi:hypothetical protein
LEKICFKKVQHHLDLRTMFAHIDISTRRSAARNTPVRVYGMNAMNHLKANEKMHAALQCGEF